MTILRRWKTWLALAIVFAAGLLIGGVGAVRLIQREFRSRMDSTTWTPRTMQWLQTSALLTEAQQAEVRPVVEASVQRLIELRDDAESERKLIVAGLVADVASKLPSPQRERFVETCRAAATKPSAWSPSAAAR